ncbi:TetR/AcrR family transcriptional regulator [Aldersonia kunmingensis]|uniref:TetR/AcrR family transcriptional regulator n=1 Tax=Aldersonia kunmingensis TaxID=408066 RepID=UPI0008372AC8|nr:TetR/AcrR family transcriptional regulator [Aldersonia kunmingensis]
MRTRGWQGRAPSSDDEARERIVSAARQCVDRYGAGKTTLADVATELGITRQTVYRYFNGMPAILYAVGHADAATFLDEMTSHVAGYTDPGEILVESIVFTVQTVPGNSYTGLLLQVGESQLFARGATSSTSMEFAQNIVRRLPIDWDQTPLSGHELDNLTELLLRLVVSFLEHPPEPPRSGEELREFLRGVIRPMLAPRANTESAQSVSTNGR